MSSSGMMPPPKTTTSSSAALVEQLDHPREQRHVRAGQDRQADAVGVLLDGGLDDLLRRLVQAGVDDLHAGVAQRPRDDLGAAVVPVEAGLGDDDADAAGASDSFQRTAMTEYASVSPTGAPAAAGRFPCSAYGARPRPRRLAGLHTRRGRALRRRPARRRHAVAAVWDFTRTGGPSARTTRRRCVEARGPGGAERRAAGTFVRSGGDAAAGGDGRAGRHPARAARAAAAGRRRAAAPVGRGRNRRPAACGSAW